MARGHCHGYVTKHDPDMSHNLATPVSDSRSQSAVQSDVGISDRQTTALWYCPSRWLLAHHDQHASANTMSSHMCLADLVGDGENLLAFVDFKRRYDQAQTSVQTEKQQNHPPVQLPPYDCRLRVYRNQQLIYNHFLDDLPSALLSVTSRLSSSQTALSNQVKLQHGGLARGLRLAVGRSVASGRDSPAGAPNPQFQREGTFLAAPINDHVYFYHKLRASHRLALEDDPLITDSLQRSEFDAWQMVRQNKVDIENLGELLSGLQQELGSQELTSHTNNFLALNNLEDRKNYILMWKIRGMNGGSESLMSMDTICCAATRTKYTASGDHPSVPLINNPKWNMILGLQRDGIVLGTEDRHLMIYELRDNKCQLESHYRLPATPDHILVECRSPSTFSMQTNSALDELDVKSFTYKIIVSCRNCRIYSIDQTYLITGYNNAKHSLNSVTELVALSSPVVDLCWTGDDQSIVVTAQTGKQQLAVSEPNFIVACSNRKVYCFGSSRPVGQCKWVVELEAPITCIVCLPHRLQAQSNDSYNLIGVASQADRIDFYISSSGRIVDSIYFANNNFCQAMTFGRFGREDNCLCATTNQGHLLILILKRTAKFGHGQCLSSAASHATDCLINCRMSMKQQQQNGGIGIPAVPTAPATDRLNLKDPPNLPSAFNLATRSARGASKSGETMESLIQSDHDCDQVVARSTLDSIVTGRQQIQVPAKSRDFVDQLVDQSLHSAAISRLFAKHMIKLRDKVCVTIDQQTDLKLASTQTSDGNRITLARITGLGNTYRVSLSLRLNLKLYVERHLNHLLSGATEAGEDFLKRAKVCLLLFAPTATTKQCQLKPFKFELSTSNLSDPSRLSITGQSNDNNTNNQWILDKTVDFKLVVGSAALPEPVGEQQLTESVSLDVYALLKQSDNSPHLGHFWQKGRAQAPVFISSINIPCTC